MEAFSTTACNNGPTPQVVTAYNPANNQISSSTASPLTLAAGSYLYDASGNTLYDGSNRYWYDAEGQLCAVQSQRSAGAPIFQYVYDAEGARIAKGTLASAPSSYTATCAPPLGSGFTLTAWYLVDQGGDQVTEVNGSGTWQHSNVWAGGNLTATWDVDGIHFELADPLGTKRVQANASGQVDETCTGLPFGNDLGNPIGANCTQLVNSLGTGDDATEHHFTGKERDTESGNDYFGARYYASSMGRWMSPDWSAKAVPVPYAKLSNPQTLNLYSYVANNPLAHFDADGHTITCTGNQCNQYIAALQKATGLTFAADKNGLLSITSKPDKMGYVGSAVAGVIGDKKNAVNISADSHNDVLGGHYAGHGNQVLNFDSINAMSSARGGFTPQSIVTHETMEAYVGLQLGGAYDMATYSKAHAAAIGFENAERISEGLPARIDEYGTRTGANTFHGTVNFSFWKESFDVNLQTNGVSNVTSQPTNQPASPIQ
jgi:RHS repeat-associated protein